MSVRFELPANVNLPENLKPAGTSGKRLLEIERARAVSSLNDLPQPLLELTSAGSA